MGTAKYIPPRYFLLFSSSPFLLFFFSSNVVCAGGVGCWAMLSRIPTDASSRISEDEPLLMKGRVTPVAGMEPVAVPMFTSACQLTSDGDAGRKQGAEWVLGLLRDPKTAPTDRALQRQASQANRPESQFFGIRGER